MIAALVLHVLYGPGSVGFGLRDIVFEGVISHGLLVGAALVCGARACWCARSGSRRAIGVCAAAL